MPKVDIDRQEIYTRMKEIKNELTNLLNYAYDSENPNDTQPVGSYEYITKKLDSLEMYVLGYEAGKVQDYRDVTQHQEQT